MKASSAYFEMVMVSIFIVTLCFKCTGGGSNAENDIDIAYQFTIGAGESDTDILFSSVGPLTFDSQNNVYILDRMETLIKVFDSTGNYIRSIGKKGQGPGEILLPVALLISKDDDLYVFDAFSSLISIYSLDGIFKKSIRFPALRSNYCNDFILDEMHMFYIQAYTASHQRKVIQKYSAEGEFLDSFAGITEDEIERIERYLNTGRIAGYGDSGIVMALPVPYSLSFFDKDGTLKKEVTKKFPYIKKPVINANGALHNLFRIVDVSVWKQYIFVLVAAFDPETRTSEALLHIFDAEGTIVKEKKFHDLVLDAGISRDGMYYMSGSSEMPQVSVYKIVNSE